MSVTGCMTLPTPSLEATPSVLPNGYCTAIQNSTVTFEGTYISSKAVKYSKLKDVIDVGINVDVGDYSESDVYNEAINEGTKYGKSLTDSKIWSEVLSVSDESNSLIFDYSSLLYNNIVLPKKLFISEGGQFKQKGLLHERNLTYRVEGDFSIITNPPSWRNFFSAPPKNIYVVQTSSLVTAKKHKDEWGKGFLEGYNEGVCLSYLDMLRGLNKLSADYSARYQYVVADHAGFTKSPSVKFVDQDVIIDGNAITIGSRIYKVKDRGYFDEQSNWGTSSNEQ